MLLLQFVKVIFNAKTYDASTFYPNNYHNKQLIVNVVHFLFKLFVMTLPYPSLSLCYCFVLFLIFFCFCFNETSTSTSAAAAAAAVRSGIRWIRRHFPV